MDQQEFVEKRFTYKMKPLLLVLFSFGALVEVHIGLFGISPFFDPSDYALEFSDDTITGLHAYAIGALSVLFSVIWLTVYASMVFRELFSSKHVILGTHGIGFPRTVGGTGKFFLDDKDLMLTEIKSDDECGRCLLVHTDRKEYYLDSDYFANMRQFDIFSRHWMCGAGRWLTRVLHEQRQLRWRVGKLLCAPRHWLCGPRKPI